MNRDAGPRTPPFGVNRMRKAFSRSVKEVRGQGLVEYALILTLLVVAAVAGVSQFAAPLAQTFQRAADCNAKPHSTEARACQDTGPRAPQNKN